MAIGVGLPGTGMAPADARAAGRRTREPAP